MKLNKPVITILACTVILWPTFVMANIELNPSTVCELRLLKPRDQAARLRLALDDASVRPEEVSANIQAYGLKKESDRLLVAKTVAKMTMYPIRWHTDTIAVHIDRFKIHNQSDLISLAKVEAQKSNPQILSNIKNFGIQDQKALYEILDIALNNATHLSPDTAVYFLKNVPDMLIPAIHLIIKHGTFCISEIIQHLHIPDQSIRLEIAQAALKGLNRSHFIFQIQNFSLKESDKITIAKWMAANTNHFSQQINLYDIQSEADRIEIAKITAIHDSHLSANIPAFKIQDKAALLEIAKIHASTSFANGYRTDFGNFKIEKENDRIDVAKILAANPKKGYLHISGLDIQNRSTLFELAKMAAHSMGPAALNQIEIFKLSEDHLSEVVDLAFANSERVHTYFKNEGLFSFVYQFEQSTQHSSLLLPYLPMVDETIQAYTQALFSYYDQDQPMEVLEHLLGKGKLSTFIPLLQDHSKHAAVSIRLFQEIFKLAYQSSPEDFERLKSRMDSLSLIEIGLGLPDHSLDAWLEFSNDRRNTFYELALEVMRIKRGIFSNTPQMTKILTKKDGYQLLQLIRDIEQLEPGSSSELASLFSDPGSALEKLKSVFNIKLKNIFQDSKLNFSYEQFLHLKEKWLNLDPFLTLIARFKGNPKWQDEIPILTRIFQSALVNEFDQLKFHKGFTTNDERRLQEQISFLSFKQLEDWKKMRTEVEVVNLSQLSQFHSDRSFYDTLNNNLIPHLASLKLPLVGIQAMQPIDFKTFFDRPPRTGGNNAYLRRDYSDSQIVFQIIEFLKSHTPLESIAVLDFFFDHYTQLLPAEIDLQQIDQDLRTLIRALPQKNVTKQKGLSIVFTTTLKDAKSLLTVGDLVDASSCQNYKTGSYIQTLLGYVLDANVQAIVSYALSIKDFKNEKEFLQAARIIEKNPAAINFNPDKQHFVIIGPEQTIVSKTVPKGYHRQILKLGKTANERPGLYLERPYVQNHAAQLIMEMQTKKIYIDLKRDIDANEGIIYIPRSRNPGGVYSDASGGLKTESYEIQ